MFNSDISTLFLKKEMRKSLLKKPHLETINFKQKHGYLIHTWSDKAFKSTVVNPYIEGHFYKPFNGVINIETGAH